MEVISYLLNGTHEQKGGFDVINSISCQILFLALAMPIPAAPAGVS